MPDTHDPNVPEVYSVDGIEVRIQLNGPFLWDVTRTHFDHSLAEPDDEHGFDRVETFALGSADDAGTALNEAMAAAAEKGLAPTFAHVWLD